MKINFGHFQIELGHDYKNGSRIRKWDVNMKVGQEYVDMKVGHQHENGTHKRIRDTNTTVELYRTDSKGFFLGSI